MDGQKKIIIFASRRYVYKKSCLVRLNFFPRVMLSVLLADTRLVCYRFSSIRQRKLKLVRGLFTYAKPL